MRPKTVMRSISVVAIVLGAVFALLAQTPDTQPAARRATQQSHLKYYDERSGKSADELVKVALAKATGHDLVMTLVNADGSSTTFPRESQTAAARRQ